MLDHSIKNVTEIIMELSFKEDMVIHIKIKQILIGFTIEKSFRNWVKF